MLHNHDWAETVQTEEAEHGSIHLMDADSGVFHSWEQ